MMNLTNGNVFVNVHRFHWLDFLLFSLLLLVSAAIGIYYGFFKKQNTTKDIFLGNKQMSILPVTLSILASFMSAISVLGTPAEIYQFGTIYFMLCLSYFISFPLAAHIYLPIYHGLQLTSAHEYLERRFNPLIRYVVSIIFILQMLFYMAIVVYAPALAFSQVSGLDMWISIVSVGVVCTFYTSIGGMKAVMWTDVLQMIIAYGAMLGVIIQGCIVLGGMTNVWDIANQHGRIKFIDFNPDPRERHTLWTLIIGGSTTTLTIYASNQAMVQRYLSMERLKDAQKAIYFAMFATLIFLLMLCAMGLVMFSYYADCDPLKLGRVTRSDQILPLYMLEIFANLPGLPGLFLACVFSAALSTVSSGVNSLATVFLEDIIRPVLHRFSPTPLSERRAFHLSRVLALTFGALTILTAFLAAYMPSTLVQIALSIFGMVGGPILAVFSVGMLLPFVNSWGAGIGFLCSLVVAFAMGIGAILAKNPLPILSMSTDGCNVTSLYNQSMNMSVNTTSPTHHGNFVSSFFRLSYLYYSAVSLVTCFIVAPFVSWLTGFNSNCPVRKQLLFPIHDQVVKPMKRFFLRRRKHGNDGYRSGSVGNHVVHEAEALPLTENLSSAARLCSHEQPPASQQHPHRHPSTTSESEKPVLKNDTIPNI